MFFGKDKAHVNEKKKLFMDKWECCDLGKVKEFLHMHIIQKWKDIHLDQHAYLDKVLECFSMTNAKSAPTPLPSNWIPQVAKDKVSPELLRSYQSIIGLLLYLMIGTCPDIAFALTKLAQFSANPSQEHFEWAKYFCWYLIGTKNYVLVFKHAPGEGLATYMDSDWASDPITRQSVTSYYFTLAGGLITWWSRAHSTVAHSSTEAEYTVAQKNVPMFAWFKKISLV